MSDILVHPFSPVYSPDSEILILGTFPSVKSREQSFYYGHPRNRFWTVISAIYGTTVPCSIDEKKELIITSRLALWDVISECSIRGSSDASIANVVPNDIEALIEKTKIKRIYANGAKAAVLYAKYIYPSTGIEVVRLPSTSPANASMALDRLIAEWNVIAQRTTNNK